MTRHISVFAIALTAACNGGQPADTDDGYVYEDVIFTDEGHVCFGTVDADTSATVTVSLPGECSAGGCAQGFEGSCEATVDGDTITLTSDLSWVVAVELPDDVGCTMQCELPVTTCDLDGLPEGTYTVFFGDEQTQLAVPSANTCAW